MANRRPIPMSEEEKAKLDRWLQERGCRCPSCGSQEWGAPDPGLLRISTAWWATQPGEYPVIVLPCRRCACLSFFSPEGTGMLQPTE